MNVEDLLRETLSDMAHEEQPPPPARFLRAGRGRSRRRGLALTAAAAVTVMAAGSTLVVQGLSSQVAAPPGLAEIEQGRTTVTVKEGLRLSAVLRQLSAATGKPVQAFEQAAEAGKALGLPAYAKGKLEGFAFPGTYEVSPESTPEEILAATVTRFHRAAENADLVNGARRVGRTPLEIVTIASIVQAETLDERDMPKVARVIHNRLNRKPEMRLQLDSTVLYGLNKYGVEASPKDLRSRSPYNTYAHLGLPPGPIGNPGADAIEAALKPAKGAWLYFVTTDPKKGTVEFAASESEFAHLVKKSRTG